MSLKRLRRSKATGKSKGHLLIRSLLEELYPQLRRLEEEGIRRYVGGRATTIYVDFALPDLGVAIEVQGVQHEKYVKHFHGSPAGFAQSKARDAAKAELLRGMGYRLLCIDDAQLKTINRTSLCKLINDCVTSQDTETQ